MQAGIRAPSRSLFFHLFKQSRLPETNSWMEILVLSVRRSFWMNSKSNNKRLLSSSSSPPTFFLNINISCDLSEVQCQAHQIQLKNTPLFCGKLEKMRGLWCFSFAASAPLGEAAKAVWSCFLPTLLNFAPKNAFSSMALVLLWRRHSLAHLVPSFARVCFLRLRWLSLW